MILERIHLAIVQAVEQHGSLTAAAERLCVTQSALSHSVRKLEGAWAPPCGCARGAVCGLTPAGQQVLILAQRVLPHSNRWRPSWRKLPRASAAACALAWSATRATSGCSKWWHPIWPRGPNVEVDVKQKFPVRRADGAARLRD